MGIEVAIASAALAVSAGSAYVSNKNQKKSIAAQNEAQAYQVKQNDLAAARQKRDAIRQARVARANAENAGASQGVMDSSSLQGGIGSIQSQLGSELSFLDTWNKYSDQASAALGRANVYSQKAQTAASISSLAMGAFNNAGTLAGYTKKIFSS